MMETAPLNKLRTARGLRPFHGAMSIWTEMLKQNVPVIVPIHVEAFGGKPEEWGESAVLTDFIFLRRGGGSQGPLAPDMKRFVDEAHARKSPIVVMAFSSMPVPRLDIIRDAIQILDCSKHSPSIIALIGNAKDSQANGTLMDRTEQSANDWKAKGRLFEDKGAPFGTLFQEIQCAIIHGGLGTTAEALRAGLPTIVTGTLLMDQRFWGNRVSELRCGPLPVHIENFNEKAAEFVDKAIQPGSAWAERAREVADLIRAQSADGVPENVEAIRRMAAMAKPVQFL
eukprot:c17698_g1_i5.p1 GENE.c17698_g1_i5~~c17698_g1_i5.p1  ORF type:complete len:334 (+),score=98.80 c17698_g1_i5:153-1004(+)